MIDKEVKNFMEEEQEKIAFKIFFSSGHFTGIAVGLVLLALLAPVLGRGGLGDALAEVFMRYGVYLFAYVALMMAVYVFMRKQIFDVNVFMRWIVLSTLAVLFCLDGYNAIMNPQSLDEMRDSARLEADAAPGVPAVVGGVRRRGLRDTT